MRRAHTTRTSAGGRSGGPRRAFTLVEMMVALFVASLVALMVMGVVRTTVRVVGDGAVDEQRGTRNERVRALLTAQLAWLDVSGDNEQSPPVLGGANWLQTRTLVSLRAPHRREPAVARLRVLSDPAAEGGWRLLYSEETSHDARGRPSRRQDAADDSVPAPPDPAVTDPEAAARAFNEEFNTGSSRQLLGACAWIEIAYLMRMAGGELSWEKDWVGRVGSPRAVRIMWSTMNGEEREWVLPVVGTY